MSECSDVRQGLVRSANDRFGVDVEFLVHVGDLSGSTEGMHPDKAAFEAKDGNA